MGDQLLASQRLARLWLTSLLPPAGPALPALQLAVSQVGQVAVWLVPALESSAHLQVLPNGELAALRIASACYALHIVSASDAKAVMHKHPTLVSVSSRHMQGALRVGDCCTRAAAECALEIRPHALKQ